MEKAGGLRNCLELMRLWERKKKIQIPGIDLWRAGPGAEDSCTPPLSDSSVLQGLKSLRRLRWGLIMSSKLDCAT